MLTAVDQYVDDPRRRKESRLKNRYNLKHFISGLCVMSGKFLGNYLMVLYLFIKLAFIANCICQLFVLNLLLGHEFHKFGFELMDKILNGKGWDTGSRIFPKISMCDFRIREVGNPKVSHRYTVQCVLPINLFNQQIFTFIWFWYTIVLLVNIYSLFVWTYRFLPSKRLRYISRRIEIMRQALFYRKNTKNPLEFDNMENLQVRDFERDIIKQFVNEYLESDGLFILRVLSSNTSDFVCTELIQELWKYYRKHRKFNRNNSDEDDDPENSEENFSHDDDEMNKKGAKRIQKIIEDKNNYTHNEIENDNENYQKQNEEEEYGENNDNNFHNNEYNENNHNNEIGFDLYEEKPIKKIQQLRKLSDQAYLHNNVKTGINNNNTTTNNNNNIIDTTSRSKKLFRASKQKIIAINRFSNLAQKTESPTETTLDSSAIVKTSRTRMLRNMYRSSSSSKTSFDNRVKEQEEREEEQSRSCSPPLDIQPDESDSYNANNNNNNLDIADILIEAEEEIKNKKYKKNDSKQPRSSSSKQNYSSSSSPSSPMPLNSPQIISSIYTQEQETNTKNPNYVIKTTRTTSQQLVIDQNSQDENKKNVIKNSSHHKQRESSASKLNSSNSNSNSDNDPQSRNNINNNNNNNNNNSDNKKKNVFFSKSDYSDT